MGLAEPRKRTKLSHDPNNLSWAHSAASYGQRLLTAQGWKPGQGLGARDAKHFNAPISKINIIYKDDNLGLGALLKSKDPEHMQTGLDAFQGLLGRLNGKTEIELRKDAKQVEDRKLAMWAQGRWGGVIFVPGGKLVQTDKSKTAIVEIAKKPEVREITNESALAGELVPKDHQQEKRRCKAERKLRKGPNGALRGGASDSCDMRKVLETNGEVAPLLPGDGTMVEKVSSKEKKRKKRERSQSAFEQAILAKNDGAGEKSEGTTPSAKSNIAKVDNPIRPQPRTGRHLLRERNVQAKRAALADSKMLDEIFMRRP